MSDSQDRSEHVERIAKIINPVAFGSRWAVGRLAHDEETIKSKCREWQDDALHKAEEILKYLDRNTD